MSILKSKKVIISVALVILLIVITLVGLSQQSVEVFTNASYNEVLPQYLGPVQVDYLYFDNYDEADRRTDLAIIGEVVKVNDEDIITGEKITENGIELERHVYTVSDIRVDKVLKGKVNSGDNIKVKQNSFSGETDYFKPGERHLLFLESYEDSKYKAPCSPINPIQGNIKIVNGKTQKRSNYQFINDGVPEKALVKAIKERVETLSKDK